MAKSLGILELNDYQLQLSLLADGQENGSPAAPINSLAAPINSSGYATIDAKQQSIKFGHLAQQQFRRQPLSSYNQYWNQLNVDPINTNHNKLRHFADFAHQQLLDLHAQANFDELIIVVPASFNREKLSLLLGICGQCPFAVVGLVDSAVLGASDFLLANSDTKSITKILHVDIQLHQCLLTHLSSTDDQPIATQVNNADIIPGTGISQLYTRLAHYLSEQFIEQCRFDPIHNADSEQQLYNLLEQLTGGDKSQELQLSLEGKQITLNRQSIWRHADDLFDELIDTIEKSAPFDTLFVHQRITTIDSLYNRLTDKFADKVQVIEQQTLASNALACQTQIVANEQGLQYTTRLMQTAQPATSGQDKQQTAKPASHLLVGHQAYPLNGKNLYIGKSTVSPQSNPDALVAILHDQTLAIIEGQNIDGKSIDAQNIKINGQPAINHQPLNLGDNLQINDQQAMLINVLTDAQLKG